MNKNLCWLLRAALCISCLSDVQFASLATGHVDYTDEELSRSGFPEIEFVENRTATGDAGGARARRMENRLLPERSQLRMRGVKKQHGVGSCAACAVTSAVEAILQQDFSVTALLMHLLTVGKVGRADGGTNMFQYCQVLLNGLVAQAQFPEDSAYGQYVAERRRQGPESCLAASDHLYPALEDFWEWCRQKRVVMPARVAPQFSKELRTVGVILSEVMVPAGYHNPLNLNTFRLSIGKGADPLYNIKRVLTKLPVVMSLPYLADIAWDQALVPATDFTLKTPPRVPYNGADRHTDALKGIMVFPDYLTANDQEVIRGALLRLKNERKLTDEAYIDLVGVLEQRIKENSSHAVCVYGYDDTRGVFLAQNSWGVTWGDQGRFRIAYEHVLNFARNIMAIVPSADVRIDSRNRTAEMLTQLLEAYKVSE